MREIKFSIYGDQPSSLENPSGLLQEFGKRYHVSVQVERMTWHQAWPQLLDYSLHGGGPHLSQVGTIWTSSLRSMNVLRPFSLKEVTEMGGTDAFPAVSWGNSKVSDEGQIWGIPFTGFTYFILYRRDLLREAGIEEATAFTSAEAMEATVQKLKVNGVRSPIILPAGIPFQGRIHMAASWIWGAGGNFLSDDGRQIRFDDPTSLAGLSAFFRLYQHISPLDHNLNYTECIQRLAGGNAAIVFAGTPAYTEIDRWRTPEVLENLGAAPMPGVPWVGGSNLVIWQEAQMYPEADRAAVQLIQFLTSPEIQLPYAKAEKAIPASTEALARMEFDPPVFGPVVRHAMATGRAYRQVPLWVRILNGLRGELDLITAQVLADPQVEIESLVADRLQPLAKRFNLLLNY